MYTYALIFFFIVHAYGKIFFTKFRFIKINNHYYTHLLQRKTTNSAFYRNKKKHLN